MMDQIRTAQVQWEAQLPPEFIAVARYLPDGGPNLQNLIKNTLSVRMAEGDTTAILNLNATTDQASGDRRGLSSE